MFDATPVWRRLAAYAVSWGLPRPRLRATWVDLPPAFAVLAQDGWIERSLLEPPGSESDREALERETGLAVPQDLCALHAVHDGSFSALLPFGMTLLPYAAMLTTWRSFAALADEYSEGVSALSPARTHLAVAYHRRWLPIATSDDAALLLDFAPGPEGAEGQVLLQMNESDYVVAGSSTGDFLFRWLSLLDDGLCRFSSDYGHAVPTGEAQVEDLLRR